ncbi:DNA polymerase-3 subunit epsilon [Desulfuromusa kysingii]|uniref:DNA polymerase-3 subunit epsilon n=1 Tax=Desulfuromusa kysingii TaxID=37625 RepID=A0A1H4C4J3_9BACT|nr:3'-5' exonuclease [Desulfuromusa kysingii]SEA55375.1 DNA polymerase-3 subunit epsilon [Desulfuromusa kysingii]
MLKSLLKGFTGKKKESADPLLAYVIEACGKIEDRSSLKQSIHETSFCVLDLETTGLDMINDVIINIGAVKLKKGKITKLFEAYTKPPIPIPAASTEFHGMVDSMFADKPVVGEVLPELLQFIGDSVIVGHHINFDIRMLHRHLKEFYNIGISHTVWLDTMFLYQMAHEDQKHQPLEHLLERYCVQCDQRHTALGDVVATAKVFVKIMDELPPSYKTIGDLFRAQDEIRRKE